MSTRTSTPRFRLLLHEYRYLFCREMTPKSSADDQQPRNTNHVWVVNGEWTKGEKLHSTEAAVINLDIGFGIGLNYKDPR